MRSRLSLPQRLAQRKNGAALWLLCTLVVLVPLVIWFGIGWLHPARAHIGPLTLTRSLADGRVFAAAQVFNDTGHASVLRVRFVPQSSPPRWHDLLDRFLNGQYVEVQIPVPAHSNSPINCELPF